MNVITQGYIPTPQLVATQGYGSQSAPPLPGPLQTGAVIVMYIPTAR